MAKSNVTQPRPMKQLARELKAAQGKLDRALKHTLPITSRITTLDRELAEHPDRLLGEVCLGARPLFPKDKEPELGAYLRDILRELNLAQDIVLTAACATRELQCDHSESIAKTIQIGADTLFDQICRLERAIEHARLRGSQMVVVSDTDRQEVANG